MNSHTKPDPLHAHPVGAAFRGIIQGICSLGRGPGTTVGGIDHHKPSASNSITFNNIGGANTTFILFALITFDHSISICKRQRELFCFAFVACLEQAEIATTFWV
jgi:hypothetical protein